MKYTPALPPRAHQTEGLEKARGREGFGWLMEMGTGKTKTDLDETGELFCSGDISACLILAPKGVYTNWLTDEVPKHWTDEFRELVITGAWRGGGTRANKEEVNRLFSPDPATLKFFCMNIEALSQSDRAFDVAYEFVKRHQGRVKISIDESTVIKNHQAQRTRSVGRLREMAAVRRILTGQPVPNGPMDLFSQMDWAVPGCLGGSFYSYRARYAILQKQFFGNSKKAVQMIVGYRDLPELAQRIRPHSFRKRKEECLDLPEQIYTPFRHVELTPEQRRIYNEVRDNATARINDAGDHVTATLVLTQLLRLQQILCGHVVDEVHGVHELPSNRPQAALDWTEECRSGGVVWCAFQNDVQRVQERLERAYPGRVAPYHGGISQEECDVNKRRFQDGSADWFLGSLQKGARGLTLVRASDTLYYSNTQNLDHRDQSESRTHRDGQHWPCTYSDLVVPGTIEETMVIPSLRKKIDLATVVMSDPTRRWLV
jgi:SNF2 family DNA or RNA helicase